MAPLRLRSTNNIITLMLWGHYYSNHKHCDNAATNSNSKNARSRMVASLQGSVGTGTKEDESSTGRVWAAGFHHVTAPYCLAHALKFMKFISLIFQIFSGRGKSRILNLRIRGSACTRGC
jgi:hypothetical protein